MPAKHYGITLQKNVCILPNWNWLLGYLERFTVDYDLPNEYNYSESCASIGLALFGLRMAQITGESQYMDVVERALYNTVLAGIALDGKSFFYVNPLEVWPPACMEGTSKKHVKPIRQKWFGVACCPRILQEHWHLLASMSIHRNLRKRTVCKPLCIK